MWTPFGHFGVRGPPLCGPVVPSDPPLSGPSRTVPPADSRPRCVKCSSTFPDCRAPQRWPMPGPHIVDLEARAEAGSGGRIRTGRGKSSETAGKSDSHPLSQRSRNPQLGCRKRPNRAHAPTCLRPFFEPGGRGRGSVPNRTAGTAPKLAVWASRRRIAPHRAAPHRAAPPPIRRPFCRGGRSGRLKGAGVRMPLPGRDMACLPGVGPPYPYDSRRKRSTAPSHTRGESRPPYPYDSRRNVPKSHTWAGPKRGRWARPEKTGRVPHAVDRPTGAKVRKPGPHTAPGSG